MNQLRRDYPGFFSETRKSAALVSQSNSNKEWGLNSSSLKADLRIDIQNQQYQARAQALLNTFAMADRNNDIATLEKLGFRTSNLVSEALSSSRISADDAKNVRLLTDQLDADAQSRQAQNSGIFVPELLETGTVSETEIVSAESNTQLQNAVKASIEENIQNNPEGVQAALTQGMTTLIGIEARLKRDSGNINYSGFNTDTSFATYMDFNTQNGTVSDSPAKVAKLGIAAQAMAGDIVDVFATGKLAASEGAKLKDVLADIIGDAELTVTYMGQTDTIKNTEGRLNRLNNQLNGFLRNKAFVENPFDVSGRLKPDVTYRSGEFGYNYETDRLRRITKFNTNELQLTGRDTRLKHNPNTPGKLSDDHAGHLAGDLFGGSKELDNLVSQSPNVNLSEYRKIENIWAKAIREGKKVSLNVEVIYEGDSLRPSEFVIQYEIDGIFFERTINNN